MARRKYDRTTTGMTLLELVSKLFAVALLMLNAKPAHAALHFAYEGTIDEAYLSASGGGIFDEFLGKLLRADLVVDATTLDQNSSPANGDYRGAVTALTVTLGDIRYESSAASLVVVDSPAPPAPDLFMLSMAGESISGPTLRGMFKPWRFEFGLVDPSASRLASDALPLLAPDPLLFAMGSIALEFQRLGQDPSHGVFDLETLTLASSRVRLAAVPLPGTLCLLASAAGLVCGVRRTIAGLAERGNVPG